MIHEVFVSNTLLFTQQVTTEPKYASGSNHLNLKQSVTTNIKYASVRQTLSLKQTVSRAGSVFNRSVSDFLGLYQKTHPKAIDVSVLQNLVFTQSLDRTYEGDNTLTFTQNAIGIVAKPTHNTLVFTQTVGLQRVINRTINQTLLFNQRAGVVPPHLCKVTTTLDDPPITRINPFVITQSDINLSITLEPPDFSNSEEFDFNNQSKRTRGGDLIIFRASDWPKITKLTYSWTYLKRDDALDVIDFLKNTVGKVVTIVDHESRNHQGIILNPTTAVVQQGKHNYTFDLEVELIN